MSAGWNLQVLPQPLQDTRRVDQVACPALSLASLWTGSAGACWVRACGTRRPCSAHLGRQDEATRGFPYVPLVMGVLLPLAASEACLSCLRLRRFCVSLVLGFRRLWVQLDLCDPFHK